VKYRYKVIEENYLDMLKAQLKQKRRSFVNVFFAAIFTLGQLSLLAYYTIFKNPSPELLSWAWPLSIFTVVLQASYQFSIGLQAKSILKLLLRKDQIPKDFWKEHRLELHKSSLTLKFGSQEGAFNCRHLDRTAEEGNVLLLYFNYGDRKTMERIIVPLNVFKSDTDKAEFLTALKEASEINVIGADEDEHKIPEGYRFHFSYDYDIKSYFRDQRQAYRAMYLTGLTWTTPNIFKLLITVFLIYLALSVSLSLEIYILLIIGCILLNVQHIMVFSPLINGMMKRGIDSMMIKYLENHAEAYITDEGIIVDSKTIYSEVPFSDIKHIRKLHNAIAVYLPQNAILTIPVSGVKIETINNAVNFISYWSNYQKTQARKTF